MSLGLGFAFGSYCSSGSGWTREIPGTSRFSAPTKRWLVADSTPGRGGDRLEACLPPAAPPGAVGRMLPAADRLCHSCMLSVLLPAPPGLPGRRTYALRQTGRIEFSGPARDRERSAGADVAQLSRIESTFPWSTSIMYRMPLISAASRVRAAKSSRERCSKANFRLPAISWRRPWPRRS